MVVNFMTMCIPNGSWYGPTATEMRCNNGSTNNMGVTTQCQDDWYNGYNDGSVVDSDYCSKVTNC